MQRRTGILLVDDEAALRTVMQQYLERLGYSVSAFGSGEEAWAEFSSRPDDYGLVVLDIMLPDMSGRELLTNLLDRNPKLCVLICSGYPFEMMDLPEEVREHAEFLHKPFPPNLLADAVKRLLPQD